MDALIRRLIDIVGSFMALLVLSPVMAVIGVLIKRDSEGPAIFRQERVGRHGRTFTLLKFRTMNAANVEVGPQVTAGGDARITTVGRTLRSTKLDELPQLVNVLRADMSLVGPRPEVARYVAHWTQRQREVILSVRPGITDPVTVDLRREEEILCKVPYPEAYYIETLLPAKADRYVKYVAERSLRSDFGVMARTIRAIIWS